MKLILFSISFLAFALTASELETNLTKLNPYNFTEIERLRGFLDKGIFKDEQMQEYVSYLTVLGYQFNGKTEEYRKFGKEAYENFSGEDKKYIHPANNKTKQQISSNFDVIHKRVKVLSSKEEMVKQGKILFEWTWVTPKEKKTILAERKFQAAAAMEAREKLRKELEDKKFREGFERAEQNKRIVEDSKKKPSRSKLVRAGDCSQCAGTGRINVYDNGRTYKDYCRPCKGTGSVFKRVRP